MEAALSRPQQLDSRAYFLTPWGNEKTGEFADRAKHDAYVVHMRNTVASFHPFLLGLFDNAKALVLLAPGTFNFCLPIHAGVSFDIPQLSRLASLTPFTEPGEQAH